MTIHTFKLAVEKADFLSNEEKKIAASIGTIVMEQGMLDAANRKALFTLVKLEQRGFVRVQGKRLFPGELFIAEIPKQVLKSSKLCVEMPGDDRLTLKSKQTRTPSLYDLLSQFKKHATDKNLMAQLRQNDAARLRRIIGERDKREISEKINSFSLYCQQRAVMFNMAEFEKFLARSTQANSTKTLSTICNNEEKGQSHQTNPSRNHSRTY